MDKNYFIKRLEEKDVDLEKSKKHWNSRAEEFYGHSKKADKNSTIEFLKGFIDLKDKSVLDLGFGAGRYLKLLSDEGAKLTGIEISDQMIKYAKKHCMENGIDVDKMDLYNLPWEDIDLDKWNWRNKFDLVFASKSPLLSSYESIKKLIGASKKGVFCSTHISMEEDVLSKVYKEINGQEYESKKDNFWNVFNILYLEGYYPNIKFEETKAKVEFTLDELVYRYSRRVYSQSPNEEDLMKLKGEIKKHELDGKIMVNMGKKDVLIYFEKAEKKMP